MLKKILLAILSVVIITVGYIGWAILNAVSSTPANVTSEVEISNEEVIVKAVLTGNEDVYEITQIEFPKEYGKKLDIKPPKNYTLTPYTLNDTGDSTSEESKKWVESKNLTTIRWVGNAKIDSKHPLLLKFPIGNKVTGSGDFNFVYEKRVGLGGSMAFFDATVAIN